MRDKNITRAAKALYQSQGDDKNELLAKRIHDPKVKEIVKDQGRVLVVLEKLILPKGTDAYSEEEMGKLLRKKLIKKGHRIQGDDEKDSPSYAAEKEKAMKDRLARVSSVLGMTLDKDGKKEEGSKESISPPPQAPTPLPQMGVGGKRKPKLIDDLCFYAIMLTGGFVAGRKSTNRFSA